MFGDKRTDEHFEKIVSGMVPQERSYAKSTTFLAYVLAIIIQIAVVVVGFFSIVTAINNVFGPTIPNVGFFNYVLLAVGILLITGVGRGRS